MVQRLAARDVRPPTKKASRLMCAERAHNEEAVSRSCESGPLRLSTKGRFPLRRLSGANGASSAVALINRSVRKVTATSPAPLVRPSADRSKAPKPRPDGPSANDLRGLGPPTPVRGTFRAPPAEKPAPGSNASGAGPKIPTPSRCRIRAWPTLGPRPDEARRTTRRGAAGRRGSLVRPTGRLPRRRSCRRPGWWRGGGQ